MMNFNDVDFELIQDVINLEFDSDESTFIKDGLIVQDGVLIGYTFFVTPVDNPRHNQKPTEDLYLSPKVHELGDGCLSHQCRYLNIYVPKSVTKINNLAFSGSMIKKVIIENPNVELGEDVFDECDDLELVVVGNKIMYKKYR